MNFTEPKELKRQEEIPEVLQFLDGSPIDTVEKWTQRSEEIKALYEYYMYGPLPDMSKEKVSFKLGEWQERKETVTMPDESKIEADVKVASLRIEVENHGKKSGFDTIVCLPTCEPKQNGYPVYLEMSFVWPGRTMDLSPNDYYAASRGYASICYNPCDVAADNSSRTGAFYEIYPYGTDWKEQTGALAAWGWGASKILDALELGLAGELNIHKENNMLSGVSRFGKATLLAGAYDKRLKVVVPACSGAGGAAMYRYKSEGKTYDFATLGHVNEEGTSTHFTTQNEALGNLQSTDLRHWFNDNFLKFDCVEQFPFDQHHLAALVADPNRYLFLISGMLGEDWVNPAASAVTYAATKQVYEFLGLSDHVCLCEHLQGHAVLLTDMVKLLDYCDVMLYEKKAQDVETDFDTIHTSVFWEEKNLDKEVYNQFLNI
ncbi:MAG: hypothetical protein J6L65_03940 [Lachnospiraceae bacterium]|nr:hypothetical protein [Lachnospiraceae bacterium]